MRLAGLREPYSGELPRLVELVFVAPNTVGIQEYQSVKDEPERQPNFQRIKQRWIHCSRDLTRKVFW
jgi:hypothetical protein